MSKQVFRFAKQIPDPFKYRVPVKMFHIAPCQSSLGCTRTSCQRSQPRWSEASSEHRSLQLVANCSENWRTSGSDKRIHYKAVWKTVTKEKKAVNHLFVGKSILHKRRTRSSRRLIKDELNLWNKLTSWSIGVLLPSNHLWSPGPLYFSKRWLQLPRLTLLQSCCFHGFRHSCRLSTASTG